MRHHSIRSITTDGYRAGSESGGNLAVRDSGPHIPTERVGKIFDPFFTTKPTGQGIGSGLAVTRKIIDLHGVRLELIHAPEGEAMTTMSNLRSPL